MALFILKYKKAIFVIGAISIVFISLLAPYKFSDNGVLYSVLGCIMDGDIMERGDVGSAFAAGTTSLWFYILAPLIAAIPVLSYISEVERSEYNKMEKMRTGRIRYNLRRLGWITVGCTGMLFLGMLLYMAVLLPFFQLSDTSYVQDGGTDADALQLIYGIAILFMRKLLYMSGYGFIVAVFAACVLCFYNDLFFVMSISFTMIYVFRQWMFTEDILTVIIPAIIFALLFILFGKWGGRT